MTVAQALRDAAAQMDADWARFDAETLMAHALGVPRSAMLLHHMDAPVPDDFAALLRRRMAGEPVAYILGTAEFYGRSFGVTPDVLIPRGDSERVVAAALEEAPDARRILDCGTGSGALLLTLLAELPQAVGIGVDASPAALAVAESNADGLGLRDRASVRRADWTREGWADGLGRFDLVIANPPYVETGARLDRSVREYEPASALFAGPDGLDDYRAIIPQLGKLMLPGGLAVLEIGAKQADAVMALAAESGFAGDVRPDLAGRPRAVLLRLGVGKGESKG